MSGFELSELPYQGLAIHFCNNLANQMFSLLNLLDTEAE
jgi:hypothetical protein